MNRPKLFCLCLALGTIAAAPPQAAQTPRPNGDNPSVYVGNDNPNRTEKRDKSRLRDVKGVVRDENDNPVEGAIVKIRNLGNGRIISWRTGKDGSYVFHDLNMDTDYELTASHDDFDAPVRRKLSQYDTRKPATMNLQIQRKKSA